jgi:hypothetical protein
MMAGISSSERGEFTFFGQFFASFQAFRVFSSFFAQTLDGFAMTLLRYVYLIGRFTWRFIFSYTEEFCKIAMFC